MYFVLNWNVLALLSFYALPSGGNRKTRWSIKLHAREHYIDVSVNCDLNDFIEDQPSGQRHVNFKLLLGGWFQHLSFLYEVFQKDSLLTH